MLVSMSDVRALAVKLAEVLVDLQARLAAPGAATTRAARVAARAALDVHAPLANRLGMWSLKASLEDAAFAVLHPREHAALAAAASPDRARRSVQTVVDRARAALDAAGLATADVSGRAKNLYGLHVKAAAKGVPIASIHDARAIRVVVDTKADCYAAERALHTLWPPVDARSKDYIRSPKPNGYQSLHSVVVGPGGAHVEVQVRTRKMHLLAEFGVAAHWKYKEAGDAASAVTRDEYDDARVAWARWLATWAHELDDQRETRRGVEGGAPFAALTGEVESAVAAAAAAAGSSSSATHPRCTFPEHAPGCGFAAWLSKGLTKGAEAAGGCGAAACASHPHSTRVLVAVLDHTSAAAAAAGPAVEAVAAGATAADLVKARAASSSSPPLRVLVNNGDRAPDAPLAPGDKVELFAAGDAMARPLTPRALAARPRSASVDGGLEDARARLDRLLAGPPATPERVRV